MDDSRDNPEAELETSASAEGDQVAADVPQSELPSGHESPSDLPLPDPSKQPQSRIDFERGSDWFDPESVRQIAVSKPEATPATEPDAGAKAESESEEEVTPAPLETSRSPASAALHEPVSQGEPENEADSHTVPAETAAQLGESPVTAVERQEISEQPPVVSELPPSEQEAVANQQELVLERSERSSESATSSASGMESAAPDTPAADSSPIWLAGIGDGDGEDDSFQNEAAFGNQTSPESAGPFLHEIEAGDAMTSAMPPLVIEVVPARWEQMLSDLADQAAERVARLTSEEIDSELNLYHHQLHAQLRALMR